MTDNRFGKIWITSVLCSVLAVCSLAGCSGAPAQKNSIKIGVTMYDQYDLFISELNEKFISDAKAKSQSTGVSISLDEYNAASSQSTQDTQVENMIQNGCDVICVNLVDRTSPANIINLAKENDVPIVFFNRQIVEEDLELWDKLYYVGANAQESGGLQGEVAKDYITEHPEVDRNGDGVISYYMLEGEPGHQDAILRTQSSVETLEEYGITLDKLGYGIANWNRDQAKTKIEQLYEEHPDVEMILSNNDAMALGAIDALDELKIVRADRPAIFGVDGISEGLDELYKGRIQGTVYNDKEGQASAMLELAYQLAMGENPDVEGLKDSRNVILDYKKVTQENVSDFRTTDN